MSNRSKILVLSDINKSTDKTLQSAINLAEILNGSIELFCVKKPTDIINKESQLSAIRSINQEYITASNKVKSILNEVKNDGNIKINSKISIGNLKDEISEYIKKVNPEIIVLGKKKAKFLNFSGDNIMSFILKEFRGTVMVTSDKKMFEITDSLNLGAINNLETSGKNYIIDNILSKTKKPITLFKVAEGVVGNNEVNLEGHREFIFEKDDNVIKNISKYLSKSNINLLFIDRSNDKFINSKSSIQDIANTVDCPLILSPN